MAASDLSTVAFIVKKVYSGRATPDLAERDHPRFHTIEKEGGFTGEEFRYALKYQNGQGISGSFAKAQANARAMSGKQWAAARKPKYGVYTLNGEAMAATGDDKGAFMRLVTTEVDGLIKELGDSLAFDMYRDGNGIRGRRGSASTNVITLTNADDARNFKVNMTVGASANADGSSPRTGTTYVTAVNLKNGTVTLNSAAAITSFADNDYLFRDGDPGTCMEGLALTTPLTAPALGSDSFRGVDRGSYPELLAGARIDDSAVSIEENMGLLAVQIGSSGQTTRKAYANPVKVFQIARRMNAKVMYRDAGGSVKWGFQYIAIETPAGVLEVVSDPDCPVDRFYLGNPESEYLKHLYALPHVIDDDGRTTLRAVNADDIEGRVRCWVNYIQTKPGDFGVGSC
jgi:hypothetical protein